MLRSLSGACLELVQRLAKLRRKQDGGTRDGDHVRDGLGQIHGGRLIGQQRRQQIDQRQQQHEFSQHGHDDRAQRAADGHERHLAGDLDAEQKTAPRNRCAARAS